VYAGTFYEGSREPRNYLLALRLLADLHPKEFERIYTGFVGGMEWAEENAAWCNTLNLGEHVQFTSFLPHRENLKVLSEADLLLMIGSVKKSDTGTLPAKLFEYAASGRPILALVHEGESARFVRGYGPGRIANPEKPEEIAAGLWEIVQAIRAGTFPAVPAEEFLRRYDRRELTRQLAEVLDQAITCKRWVGVSPAPRGV
jgi:glycosyltransferase involved in cell wall biosynthesis